MEKTVRLGAEYDESLKGVLMSVLKDAGFIIDEKTRGVAGSQDVQILKVHRGGQRLIVESETFIGLSLQGDEAAVDEVVRQVNNRRSKSS